MEESTMTAQRRIEIASTPGSCGTLKTLLASLLALTVILYTDDPAVHVAAVWAVVIFAAAVVRLDMVHPYCWFSMAFALYNTAYTILYLMGDDTSAGYSSMNAVYTVVAMGVVLLVVGADSVDASVPLERRHELNSTYNDLFFWLFWGLSVVFAFILHRRGYSGKKAMQAAGDMYYSLGVHVVRWMMVMMVIQLSADRCRSRRRTVVFLAAAMGAALLMSMYTGERDIIFRAVLLGMVLLFYYGVIKRRHILLLLPLGAGIMIASVYFKYFFLTGVGNDAYLDAGGLLYRFLRTDFHATGRNTQHLLNYAWTKGYLGLGAFFSELIRGIVPGDFVNPSAWYNYEVYPGSFKGQAFTLVGFGHSIAGLWGVALVFTVLGLFIRFVYRNSRHSIYSLTWYLYSISIVTGCYRSTLNTVVNMSIKAVLLMVLVSRFFGEVRIKGKNDP